MKQILAVHQQQPILNSLQMVLNNWGYQIETAKSPQEMNARLKKHNPDFLIIENGLLSKNQLENLPFVSRQMKAKNVAVALLGEAVDSEPLETTYVLPMPLNIFALYEALQKSLEPVPRQDVRVKVRIPGMVRPGDKHFNLGEVLCLSTGGMFIRCGIPLPTGTEAEIILPLIGMKHELEIKGEVIYQVTPTAENNYNQGVGIRFSDLSMNEKQLLEDYLEKRLEEDLSEHLGHELDPQEPLFTWNKG